MQKYHCRDFTGGPLVKISPSSAESGCLIPGHATKIPHASGPKTKAKQKQVVTNSIKTLKIVHIKKTFKKRNITVKTTHLFTIKRKKMWETMNRRKCA